MQSNSTTNTKRPTGLDFATRRAQVSALRDTILNDGQPELHADSAPTAIHLKRRPGLVGGQHAEAQVYTHTVGKVIRFWVYGLDFSVKVRELVILPSDDKGVDIWLGLDDTDKLFPHEGKYALAARLIEAAINAGF